jgi:hypothetical protein
MKTVLYWFLAINYGSIPFLICCYFFGVMPMVNALIVGLVLMTFWKGYKRAMEARAAKQKALSQMGFIDRLKYRVSNSLN